MLVELASASPQAAQAHDLRGAGTIFPAILPRIGWTVRKVDSGGTRAGAVYSSNVTLTLSVTG
jgi:hypothetical protein